MIFWYASPLGGLTILLDPSHQIDSLGFGKIGGARDARNGPTPVCELAWQLDRYFVDGVPIALTGLALAGRTAFQQRVSRLVHAIPCGETRTYGAIASLAGSAGAARAVGSVMSSNPWPVIVPCHRVVAQGSLGGYTGGLAIKRWLLAHEEKVACEGTAC